MIRSTLLCHGGDDGCRGEMYVEGEGGGSLLLISTAVVFTSPFK